MSVGSRRHAVPGGPLGVPVPPAEPGVCATCHGPARDGRAHCWCCRSVARTLGVDPLGPVVPMALFEAGDGLHAVLRGYEDAAAVAAGAVPETEGAPRAAAERASGFRCASCG